VRPKVFDEAADMWFEKREENALQIFRAVSYPCTLKLLLQVAAKIEPISSRIFDALPGIDPKIGQVPMLPTIPVAIGFPQHIMITLWKHDASEIQELRLPGKIDHLEAILVIITGIIRFNELFF
jgi:hypothetical protein